MNELQVMHGPGLPVDDFAHLSPGSARLLRAIAPAVPEDDEDDEESEDPEMNREGAESQGERIGKLEQWRSGAQVKIDTVIRHNHRHANAIQALGLAHSEMEGRCAAIETSVGSHSELWNERLGRTDGRLMKEIDDLKKAVTDLNETTSKQGGKIAMLTRWYFLVLGGSIAIGVALDLLLRFGVLRPIHQP